MIGDGRPSQQDLPPVEIKGPGRIETGAVRRKTSAGSAPGGFSLTEAPESHGGIVAGPGPIAALDSILMLQAWTIPPMAARAAWRMANNCSTCWTACATGCWRGGIPRAILNKLAVAVTRRHDSFADPKLQDVLDQIELRAHVELAKLEQMDKRVA